MTDTLRLMAILAHPDDESLAIGGTLAHYSAQGIETCLVTATRGEAGRFFEQEARPADAEVGRVREKELRAAAAALGVQEVTILGYADKALDSIGPHGPVDRIVGELRRIRPHVVITFSQDGAYGHPDHIAISQLTHAAIVASADASHLPESTPHRVSKLYTFGWPQAIWDLYEQVFKKMTSKVDGVERQATAWPEWMFTSRVNARAQWPTVWRAVQCHKTQMAAYRKLDQLTEEQHATLWGDQRFYRVFSLVNAGREVETDLFAGLR